MPHAVDAQARFRVSPDRRCTPDRRGEWRGGRRVYDVSPAMRDLVSRLLSEFAEQPGLKLTLAQAARLFAVDTATCAQVLHMLMGLRALAQTRQGLFVSLPRSSGQLRITRAQSQTLEERELAQLQMPTNAVV